MVQDIHTATWLSSVPQHWKTLRIKNLFDEIDERSETGEEELLSVSHYTGVTKKRDSLENEDDFISNAKTLVGYKKVAENDLVINIMLAWNGSLGISKYDGITSPAYCVYRIKGDNNPYYYGYLFSTAIMKAEFRKKSFGIIDSRLRLYSDKFFSIPVAVPPRDEQDQIVNYIKAKSKKIKHFIQKKQAFIELLKEQRQAVISRAVTKGINPDVTLKDSGIEWLGDIPEHWELRRLKNVCDVVLGKMLCNENKGGYSLRPYLKSKNIGWENVITDDVENMWFSDKELETYKIKENDLLVSEGGEVGKTCIWKNELEECYIQNSVHKLTLFEDCLPEYYLFWMGMLGEIGYFKAIVNQVSIAHLTRDKIVKVVCLYPPMQEQSQIVSHIKTETAKIDQAIAKAEKEIELIKEYREAMIAEAVVGKLDVKVHTKKVLENG